MMAYLVNFINLLAQQKMMAFLVNLINFLIK